MRKSLLLAVAAVSLTSACYRVTVLTGAPPAATPEVTVPFAHGFVYGLVPPSPVATQDRCRQGVAKVVTEQSVVNGLAQYLTFGLYTPQTITVTCATGPVRAAQAPALDAGVTLGATQPAMPAPSAVGTSDAGTVER